ncbi:MAG: LacI family DNA-binding transcriptional regulator [Armatimonadetes bacterium]|nr:LacI family DNA-binding transcriptional regulator [Armatimonadota bacterium]
MAARRTKWQKRKVTMLEIATAAGVSKTTVSFVLNNSPNIIAISESTRRRVLEAAKDLGYSPNAAARSLSTGRSDAILVVVFDSRSWDQSLVGRLRGVEAHLVSQGYSTHMCTVDGEGGTSTFFEILRSGRADGVLLTGSATQDTYPVLHAICGQAEDLGIPIAALADAWLGTPVRVAADIDDESGGEQATSHLIEHGHSRIALLGVAGQGWAESRKRGYEAAHEKAGIPVDPHLFVQLDDHNQTWAYEATLKLARSVDFSAMFIVSDALAVAALSALKAAGRRMPEDCAIVGFDNNETWSKFTDPPLTTVHNPFYESGFAAAETLVHMIRREPIKPVLLPVSLVFRESCGCQRKVSQEQ